MTDQDATSSGEEQQEEQSLEGQIGYKGPACLRKLAVIVGGNDDE